MNREIKFRAWDREAKVMEYDILFSGIKNLLQQRLENPKVFEVMQYTGLKDKNGKEIYEGDILRAVGIVTWNEPEVRWSCIDIEWNDKCEWHDMLYLTTPLEVIGNIYENPELITNL